MKTSWTLLILMLFWAPRGAQPVKPSRVDVALKRFQATNRTVCRSIGINYPPPALLIRVLKREGVLELWGASGESAQFKLLKRFPVTAQSGVLGPKRAEGDLQVPEGLYSVVGFNPFSRFHLSLKLDYPNRSDRIRGTKKPGGDIFIHGGAQTIGCIPIGDDGIEQLYSFCWAHYQSLKRQIPVHIFPFALDKAALASAKSEYRPGADATTLWKELAPIYQFFDKTKRLPKTVIGPKGDYRILGAP